MAKKTGTKKQAGKVQREQPKANKKPRRPGRQRVASAALAGFADLPAPGSWVLANPGSPPTIFVRTTGWAAGDRVWAKIHAVTEAPSPPADPDNNLEGFKELTPNGTNREGQVDIPAGVSCASTAPATNNITVTIAYREAGAALPTILLGRTQFKYICGTFSATVPAHACPWFAFRQDDSGPNGEDIIVHRPVKVRIPVNAATVAISASGWWRHSPIIAGADSGGSGPEGRAGEVTPLYEPRYRDESDILSVRPKIDLPDAPMPNVNTMVGVPEWKNTATAPKIFKIGSSLPSLTSPGDYNAIYLGFWDGTQWNKANSPTEISNSGEATVTFTWAP